VLPERPLTSFPHHPRNIDAHSLKISKGVLGRSIYSLEYEGNKVSEKRLDSYFKEGRKETKRTMLIMNDDERYRKRNWNKMVS